MEFERALFRIHQRALESERSRLWRLRAETVLPWAFAAIAGCWFGCHQRYVGKARCLPEALARAGLWAAPAGGAAGAPALPDDVLLGIAVADDGMAAAPVKSRSASVRAALEALPPEGDPPPSAAAPQSEVLASYTFALDKEVLRLNQEVFRSHAFKVHNLTLPASCLRGSGLLGSWIAAFEGYDFLMVNELTTAFPMQGYLRRSGGGAADGPGSFGWARSQAEAASPPGWRSSRRLAWKAVALLRALLACAVLSAVTGLFIRVAVNMSAVLLFVVAASAQQASSATCCGTHVPSIALLVRSFPWIGVYVNMLNGAGRPIWPLLRAHAVFVLMQSLIYVFCSFAWMTVYWRFLPEDYMDQVFGLFSSIELFNLTFVRSEGSAGAFPKLALASAAYLHFYLLCFLWPCRWLALWTCSVACAWAAVYCLNNFEEPALRGGHFAPSTPTAAHPRALYIPQLSPSWTTEVAPLWTMFWPPEPARFFPQGAMRSISDQEYSVA